MASEELQKGTARDYVYAGLRTSSKDKPIVAIYPVVDGKLREPALLFDAKGFKARIIGGVYRGASFNDDFSTIYNINRVKYVETWADKSRRLEWEALDDEHLRDRAIKRLEDAQRGAVAEALWPYRVMIHQMRRRGAHHEVAALVNMVHELLYRPLTKEEQGRL